MNSLLFLSFLPSACISAMHKLSIYPKMCQQLVYSILISVTKASTFRQSWRLTHLMSENRLSTINFSYFPFIFFSLSWILHFFLTLIIFWMAQFFLTKFKLTTSFSSISLFFFCFLQYFFTFWHFLHIVLLILFTCIFLQPSISYHSFPSIFCCFVLAYMHLFSYFVA